MLPPEITLTEESNRVYDITSAQMKTEPASSMLKPRQTVEVGIDVTSTQDRTGIRQAGISMQKHDRRENRSLRVAQHVGSHNQSQRGARSRS